MSDVFSSYQQTYIIKEETGEKFESARLPIVPIYHRVSFTDRLKLNGWIKDITDISGDFYQAYLRELNDVLEFEDTITTELKKPLNFSYVDSFELNEVYNERVADKFNNEYSELFSLEDDITTLLIKPTEVVYKESLALNDEFSYILSVPTMLSYTEEFSLNDEYSSNI